MLDRVLTYIDQNYLTINTIEDICDALKISRTSLYALFQKSFHTGIQKYIASLRLEYAKKLLEETDLPIYEIAYQSRFNDYNYFSHVFKKHFITLRPFIEVENPDIFLLLLFHMVLFRMHIVYFCIVSALC